MFEQFVIIAGVPKVFCHAETRWSAEAFEAAYGDVGAYTLDSLAAPLSKEP